MKSSVRGVGRKHPFVIGLTGPIASGKSTVAALLQERGALVIDADEVYRSLLHPGSDLWERVVARFGPEVIALDRQIDRAALGRIVFRDPAALADLERMTHPHVVAEIRRQIDAANAEVVVIEAVKLVESGLLDDVDSLWLVTADPEVRLRRLAARRGLSEEEARARLGASLHVAEPDAIVDILIENSGDMSLVTRAVTEAWDAVVAPAARSTLEPVATAAAKETS